uniref:CSON005508 protein n=2 Tax=Culicoides sonorensis TaxID=179676 RepID=A0A336MQQ6_CULSO
MRPSIIFLVTAISYITVIGACTAAEEFTKNQIVPDDVIDKVPLNKVEITYPNGVSVNLGNVMTPTEVKDEPTVQYNADQSGYYTLIMTDPDAPSRKNPKFREWHHWLVGNIPGNKVEEGETIAQYIGAGPPRGTGLHRYVFLIFKQKGKIKFEETLLTNSSADGRGRFNTKAFVKKYNLDGPTHGNFFQAEYDDYVPILYKQLGA